MPLDDAQLSQVRALLKECSAEVRSVDLTMKGTGFFIDDRLILSCAHVLEVDEGETVEVQPFTRKARPGKMLRRLPGEDLDLALIQVEAVEDEDPQPCVLLDERVKDDIDYFAVGYPEERLLNKSGLEEIAFTGHQRLSGDDAEVEFLNIDQGKGTIRRGLSGGAVLRPDTGAVVALVQYSEAASGNEGGAAIPIARAARQLTQVADCIKNPPAAVRRWRAAIGEQAWRELGQPSERTTRVDLYLSGNKSSWTVKVDGQAKEYALTGRDLSKDISKALFHWAQRRRIRSKHDVRLLGDLLAGAVFPAEVASMLERACGADELLIRLHVDPDSDLFDIPWELATLSVGERVTHVGVDNHLGVARVIDKATKIAPPVEGAARVIGAVMQPPNLQAQMPTLMFGPNQAIWPAEGEIQAKLARAIQGNGFDAEVISNPTPGEFLNALEDPPPQKTTNAAVHYIGRGEVQEREPRLALYDNEGGLVWRAVEEVCEWVAGSGARLFVIELTLPPLGLEPEAIAPRTFLHALAGQVEAVLFTRFPIHPSPLSTFNNVLYRHLAGGSTIESAVQAARKDTFDNRFSGDVSEFGCYTLVTGEGAGTAIFPKQEKPAPASTGGGFRERTPPIEEPPPPTEEAKIRVGFDRGETR